MSTSKTHLVNSTKSESYSLSAKILHWASAFIILSMLFLGVSMVQALATWQYEALALHQSFGVIVLVFLYYRHCSLLALSIMDC